MNMLNWNLKGGGTKPKPNKLTKFLHTSAVFRSYKLLPIKNTLKLNTQGLWKWRSTDSNLWFSGTRWLNSSKSLLMPRSGRQYPTYYLSCADFTYRSPYWSNSTANTTGNHLVLIFQWIGMMYQFSKDLDECQISERGDAEACDWAKGSSVSPLKQQRVVKSLKPVLSDCTSLNTVLLIQSSEYNTFFPLPLAQALLLQGKLNINLRIFVSTQQEADKISNCEKIHLWNS